MAIQKGDRLPDVPLTIASAEGPQPTTTGEFFRGKRVALFAVPGAFTPTCSARHLPSYVDKAGELKGQGVDEIACIAVNDPFVMQAWNERDGSSDITMLADGNGAFSDAVYNKSSLPLREFEAARVRMAQINDCNVCLNWRTARDVPSHAPEADKIDDVLVWCQEQLVPVVTIWGLSTDNLQRDPEELVPLLGIIEQKIADLRQQIDANRELSSSLAYEKVLNRRRADGRRKHLNHPGHHHPIKP